MVAVMSSLLGMAVVYIAILHARQVRYQRRAHRLLTTLITVMEISYGGRSAQKEPQAREKGSPPARRDGEQRQR